MHAGFLADVDVSKLQGTPTVAALQPSAFKDALAQGTRLWPQLAHYLASLGQTHLLKQRFESEVRLAHRCAVLTCHLSLRLHKP